MELAAAIERLVLAPELTARMGEAARQLAEQNFDAKENAKRLLNLISGSWATGGLSERAY